MTIPVTDQWPLNVKSLLTEKLSLQYVYMLVDLYCPSTRPCTFHRKRFVKECLKKHKTFPWNVFPHTVYNAITLQAIYSYVQLTVF